MTMTDLEHIPIILIHKMKKWEENITVWRIWTKRKILKSFKFPCFQICLPLPPPPELRLDQNLEVLAVLKLQFFIEIHPPGYFSGDEIARISFLVKRIFFSGEADTQSVFVLWVDFLKPKCLWFFKCHKIFPPHAVKNK